MLSKGRAHRYAVSASRTVDPVHDLFTKVRQTHDTNTLILMFSHLKEIPSSHGFCFYLVCQCLHISFSTMGRMERLSAPTNNTEADERIQPLPQAQFQW